MDETELRAWRGEPGRLTPLPGPTRVRVMGADALTGPQMLGEDTWGKGGRYRNGPGRDPHVRHSTSGCPCSPGTRSPSGFT